MLKTFIAPKSVLRTLSKEQRRNLVQKAKNADL